MIGIPPPSPAAREGGLLGLLLLDAILLGAFGLVFTPLYIGAIPLPVGALLVALVLPWLVARAASIDVRSGTGAAPLWAWLFTVLLLGLWGPGGDAMLPMATDTVWTSLLLLASGLVTGTVALRRARRRAAEEPMTVRPVGVLAPADDRTDDRSRDRAGSQDGGTR